MEIPPGRLAAAKPVAALLFVLAAIPGLQAAEPLLMVEFPALTGGKSCQAALVPLADPPLLVTVVPPGANPLRPSALTEAAKPTLQVIGHDPVSRLGFLEIRGSNARAASQWLKSARGAVGASLIASTASGPIPCKITGPVKQVGGKILPFALLKVDFQGAVPPPGTPLTDSRKRVAGIVFQAADGDRHSGYAIPAEAVHRVRRDICNGGVLRRARLGLTLSAQNATPRIVRVLPGSPAAAAGIRPDDVLLQVGGRGTRAYADVPDAFFYLIPGEQAPITVQRGSQRLELEITPAREP